MSAFVLYVFELVEEYISLRQLSKPCCSFPIFTSMGTEYVRKRFPMCLTRVRGKMTQQDHLISQFPINLFAQTQTNTYKGLIPVQLPPTVPPPKLLLLVLGRKGHAGKSLWGSIRQFSVGSAADTQVIYSEGARARTGSGGVHMLVDILPCLPNLSLNSLIMTNSFCNVLEQSGDAPPPCFHSVSHLFPRTGQLKYISIACGIVFCIFIDEGYL